MVRSRRGDARCIRSFERSHERQRQVTFAFFGFEFERLSLLLLQDPPLDFVEPMFAEHVFARRITAPKMDLYVCVPLKGQLVLGLRR